MDEMNSQRSKETIKLLDFAKSVTENIKCALEKTNKASKKKANHKKYIQRKCFTKPGMTRKPTRRISRRILKGETTVPLTSDEGSTFLAEEKNFQAMLDRESELFYASYLYMKENNNYSGHLDYPNYTTEQDSMPQYSNSQHHIDLPQLQSMEHPAYRTWPSTYEEQYPPKLKHFDYEQIWMTQQRNRSALPENAFLTMLYNESCPDFCYQSEWQKMPSEMYLGDMYHSRDIPLLMNAMTMSQ